MRDEQIDREMKKLWTNWDRNEERERDREMNREREMKRLRQIKIDWYRNEDKEQRDTER